MNISSFLFPWDYVDYEPFLLPYFSIATTEDFKKQETPVKSGRKTVNFKIV